MVGRGAFVDYGRAGTHILWKIRKGPCIGISELCIRSCAFRDIIGKQFFGSDRSYNRIITCIFGGMAGRNY